MTRLSDDAWRARMEGKKTVREAAPLPLFDAAPAPEVKPIPASESTKGLAGMLAQHERDHAAALDGPAPADPVADATKALDVARDLAWEDAGLGAAAPIIPPPPPKRTFPNEPADPWARAHAGSALAARRWTPEEVARVDAAIRTAAATGREFTADDVWELLPGLLVTKGLAGRLMAAANAGLIRNTGKTAQARRGGEHDHAQRLSVWQGTGGAS